MGSKQLTVGRPESNEYLPYYEKYISLVAGSDIVGQLRDQIRETMTLLSSVGEDLGEHRYAPDKWSIKEVLGHVIDTERIMAYRALRISRNDPTPMEGFEQDDYVRQGPFARCSLKELGEEFGCVRQASLHLFRNLDRDAWMRRGTANKAEVTVRALAYIIAGHELHHRKMLVEKYL
jgi:hypothetical protein